MVNVGNIPYMDPLGYNHPLYLGKGAKEAKTQIMLTSEGKQTEDPLREICQRHFF